MTEYLPFLNEFFYKELSMEIIGYLGVKTRPYPIEFYLYVNSDVNHSHPHNLRSFKTVVTYSSIEAKMEDAQDDFWKLKGYIVDHLPQDAIDEFNRYESWCGLCENDIAVYFDEEQTFDLIHIY